MFRYLYGLDNALLTQGGMVKQTQFLQGKDDMEIKEAFLFSNLLMVVGITHIFSLLPFPSLLHLLPSPPLSTFYPSTPPLLPLPGPQWLLFTSSQLVIVQLFLIAVIYITRKLNCVRTSRINRLSQKAQLWGCVCLYVCVCLCVCVCVWEGGTYFICDCVN